MVGAGVGRGVDGVGFGVDGAMPGEAPPDIGFMERTCAEGYVFV